MAEEKVERLRCAARDLQLLVEEPISLNVMKDEVHERSDEIARGLEVVLETLDSIQAEDDSDSSVSNRDIKPQATPDMLNLMELRVVYTALDMVWRLGVAKTVCSSLGHTLDVDNIHPKSLLVTASVLRDVGARATVRPTAQVFRLVSTLLRVCLHPSFSVMMADRTLCRVLSALFMIRADSKARGMEDMSQKVAQALRVVVVCKLPSSVLLRAAWHTLRPAPSAIRKEAVSFITKIVMGDDGVEALFETVLGEVVDGDASTPLHMHVATLLSTPPESIEKVDSADSYYENITLQIIGMLERYIDMGNMSLARACIVSFARLARAWPSGAALLLNKRWGQALLAEPLFTCVDVRSQVDIKYSEESVERCITRLVAVLTLCPPTAALIGVLRDSGLCDAILRLAFFLHQHGRVLGINTAVKSLTTLILTHIRDRGPDALVRAALSQNGSCFFAVGPMGGVQVRAVEGSLGCNKQEAGASKVVDLLGTVLGEPCRLSSSGSGVGSGDIENIISMASLVLERDGAGRGSVAEAIVSIGGRAQILIQILRIYLPKSQHSDNSCGSSDTSLRSLEDLASRIFLLLLERYLEPSIKDSCDNNWIRDRTAHGFLLMAVLEGIPIDCLFVNGTSVIQTLEVFLVHSAEALSAADTSDASSLRRAINTSLGGVDAVTSDCDDEDHDMKPLSIVLSILSAILGAGSQQRPDAEEKALRRCLRPLEDVARESRSTEDAQAASAVALMIITRGASRAEGNKQKSLEREDEYVRGSEMERVLAETQDLLTDPSPAMRGLGVRKLIITLREPLEPIIIPDLELVLTKLLLLLDDDDSFVYLNVVHAIGRLVDHNRVHFFQALLQHFGTCSGHSSIILRAKIGEVLVYALRRAGRAAPRFATQSLATAFSVVHQWTAIESIEEGQILLQSAVSLIAETIVMAGWSAAGSQLRDALDIANGILREPNHMVRLRRAGAFLVRYIVEGLHTKLLHMDTGGEHLKSAYVILKRSCDDADNIVRFQSRNALSLLSDYMREQLFISGNDERLHAVPKIKILH